MFQRFARLRLLALFGGLLLTAACSAQQDGTAAAKPSAEPFTEGQQYVTLKAPYQRYSDSGKVEVVEVFSYACIHCAHFAPIAEKLRAQLPPGVEFKLMPAPFNDEWLVFARGYYAAKQLGVQEQTHLALFKAKFEDNYPINTMDELADFYARNGANRADFLRIANSDEVTAKTKSDFDLAQKWGVEGTPTLVVDGKYVSKDLASYDDMVAMIVWLAKRELAAKQGH